MKKDCTNRFDGRQAHRASSQSHAQVNWVINFDRTRSSMPRTKQQIQHLLEFSRTLNKFEDQKREFMKQDSILSSEGYSQYTRHNLNEKERISLKVY